MARYLVTSALPYANGPLHLGHLAGAYLPADIYVRFLRLMGEDVVFVCGTDEHGVPITLTAERQGRTPREVVDEYHEVIRRDFESFGIGFDNFSRTSRPEHFRFAQEVFLDLLGKGYITEKPMRQLYCSSCDRFLPDRYVLGTCPRCGKGGARGDQCESCGSWLDALELLEPGCSICSSRPAPRETRHWFLRLDLFQGWLREWLDGREGWRDNVLNYCRGWLDEGLQERAITRDIDWGVPVPLEGAEGKVLYVWFEALLGYVSSTRELFERRGRPDAWREYWNGSDTRLVHFIGKDNIVFHAVIEPAILHGLGGFVLPWNVPANEFLNISGQKQSTSRGTAVWMRDYLRTFPPDPMRYALAVNAPEGRDTEFSWAEFRTRNNELADVLGNLVNRTVSFAHREFGGEVPRGGSPGEPEAALFASAARARDEMAEHMSAFRLKAACAGAMALAREGNRYFDSAEPWRRRKSDREGCALSIRTCLQFIDWLRVAFSPFLPYTADAIGAMIPPAASGWNSLGVPELSEGAVLGRPAILFGKLDESFDGPASPSAESPAEVPPSSGDKAGNEKAPGETLLGMADFGRVDLRVGVVLSATPVEGADKLLKLMVDIGEDSPRQVVAGIRKWYPPETLPGRMVVVVCNLEPAVLRGVESRGMILASVGDDGVFIVEPGAGARPGDRVR